MDERQVVNVIVLTGRDGDLTFVDNAIRDAGLAVRCKQVRDIEHFQQSLEDGTIELIVLSVGQFPEQITEVKELRDVYHPEIPLIALQDTVDEAAMRRATDAGASDLVSVTGDSRLRTVVVRELRTLRLERALNSKLHSSNLYRQQLDDFVRTSDTAIAHVRAAAIVDANEAWLRKFSHGDGLQIIGSSLLELFSTEDKQSLEDAMAATISGDWSADRRIDVSAAMVVEGSKKMELGLNLVMRNQVAHVQVRIFEQPVNAEAQAVSGIEPPLTAQVFALRGREEIVEILRERLASKPASGLYALAYIRPDRFSDVRRTAGTLNTEQVFTQFAETVAEHLHPNDVAGRFEETVVLVLLQRGNERSVEHWAEALVAAVANRVFQAGEQSINLSCTIGVCAASAVRSSLEDILAAAIDAHAVGRSQFGNTVVLDCASAENVQVRDVDDIWVKRIRDGLRDNRFRLAHLPIAALRGEELRMTDILIRMLDDNDNEILPAEFLPSARRNDLMHDIDCWVINSAMSYSSQAKQDCVFVRLSTQSVLESSLPQKIMRLATVHNTRPSGVCFQVPVDVADSFVSPAKILAEFLQERGFRFALEHYGTNLRSHQILDSLKPDFLKIDGEFMHALASDAGIQVGVQQLVNAARQRKIQTIAERVESANTMTVLYRIGVDFMQGSYVDEPEIVLQQPGR